MRVSERCEAGLDKRPQGFGKDPCLCETEVEMQMKELKEAWEHSSVHLLCIFPPSAEGKDGEVPW